MEVLTKKWVIAPLLFVSIVFANSCTKTEYIDFEKREDNRIRSFKIINAEQNLQGAINDEEGTVTVYIPYYLAIEFLDVEITLDEGATIYDEAGGQINLDGGFAPIPFGTDSIKLTVKSVNGVPRNYLVLQKLLPHPSPLSISIKDIDEGAVIFDKPVNGRLTILGNFESTSRNGKFTFTNKTTGEAHEDYAAVSSITPGAQYTMVVDISPEATAGEYDVRLEHQGRVVELPSIRLHYQRPYMTQILSSKHYAPGDTIEFIVNRALPNDDRYGTVFIGLQKLYARVAGTDLTYVPAGFPQNLLNQNLEMEIVSNTRTEVKAIFPELPAGLYSNSGWGAEAPGSIYHARPTYGLAFYGDFDEQTNLGNDVLINRGGSFGLTVKAKE